MKRPARLIAPFLAILLVGVLVVGLAQPPHAPAERLDSAPRLAIVSAFAPEMQALLAQTEVTARYEINGRTFTTGRLAGREVLLFESGVSMVNAAMNTKAAVDHFALTGIIFSGIAGGVNPDLTIGDVVIPAAWAQYQESVFAREVRPGEWDTGYHPRAYGNYGMIFPQSVAVTHADGQTDQPAEKFWFSVDPAMLDAARKAAAQVELSRCPAVGACLEEMPKVVVGGRGVSGPSFVDNAEYRAWVWQTFRADALDMESAAVAQVAYASDTPFLAFRSLSDLAGGGKGSNEIVTFFQLAADNSARVVVAFLRVYP